MSKNPDGKQSSVAETPRYEASESNPFHWSFMLPPAVGLAPAPVGHLVADSDDEDVELSTAPAKGRLAQKSPTTSPTNPTSPAIKKGNLLPESPTK